MSKILLETTLARLLRNTTRAFKDDRDKKSSNVRLTNTIFIPYLNNDSLEIRSISQTDNGKYNSIIIVDNVIYRDDESNKTAKIITTDGTEYYFDRLQSNRSNVKVSCTCLDFHYRFAIYNGRDDALASDMPEPYIKKTDRPEVNPTKVSGVCKHIIRLVDELKRDNIFI